MLELLHRGLALGSALTVARVGFFLEQHREPLMVEEAHLDRLCTGTPAQPRYFDSTRQKGRLISRWNLVVPENILNRRSEHWRPLEPDNIPKIFSTVNKLRGIEEYYLRNITVCIVQGSVRMQFNCDGTQIIDAHNFRSFLEETL